MTAFRLTIETPHALPNWLFVGEESNKPTTQYFGVVWTSKRREYLATIRRIKLIAI